MDIFPGLGEEEARLSNQKPKASGLKFDPAF
jgi:hypothetical protein